ncbi:MAG: histidine phosphatase family protein [Deinococcaceae bacterium]
MSLPSHSVSALPLDQETEFWVVRHAETVWNAMGKVQGHADIALSSRGLQQSERLAERLRGLSFDAVYASDLERAQKTADLITSDLSPPRVLEPRLREINVGHLSGLSHREVPERFPQYWQELSEDPWGTRRPGGESMSDLYVRVRDALLDIHCKYPGGRVLVVTHGGVVRVAVSLALGGDLQAMWARLSIENTAISRLFLSKTGSRLISYNDSAHLEGEGHIPDDCD